MSKKRNPVLGVLTYFEQAELPLAEQAVALAQSIVRRRKFVASQTPKPAAAAPAATPEPVSTPEPTADPSAV